MSLCHASGICFSYLNTLPLPRYCRVLISQVGVRFALDPEGDRLLFLEGMREYASKVTPRQKTILGKAFDEEVRSDLREAVRRMIRQRALGSVSSSMVSGRRCYVPLSGMGCRAVVDVRTFVCRRQSAAVLLLSCTLCWPCRAGITGVLNKYTFAQPCASLSSLRLGLAVSPPLSSRRESEPFRVFSYF